MNPPSTPAQQNATAEVADTSFDFRSKYTQTNFISRRLLDGFFGAITQATRGLDVKNAIEVGCGEGFSTARLQAMLPSGARFEASDIEERLVREARQRNPHIPIARESIYELARPANAYDLVFVLEVLEHLDDPARALAEVCRVSRKWVIASVPREPIWRVLNMARLKYIADLGNTPGHLNHWSSAKFQQFVGQHATVRQCHTPTPWTVVLAEVKG